MVKASKPNLRRRYPDGCAEPRSPRPAPPATTL